LKFIGLFFCRSLHHLISSSMPRSQRALDGGWFWYFWRFFGGDAIPPSSFSFCLAPVFLRPFFLFTGPNVLRPVGPPSRQSVGSLRVRDELPLMFPLSATSLISRSWRLFHDFQGRRRGRFHHLKAQFPCGVSPSRPL